MLNMRLHGNMSLLSSRHNSIGHVLFSDDIAAYGV